MVKLKIKQFIQTDQIESFTKSLQNSQKSFYFSYKQMADLLVLKFIKLYIGQLIN